MNQREQGGEMANDFLFPDDLETLDPAVDRLIKLETERQARKLIMIPSESYTPRAVRQALGSVFTNVYAEGYPLPETRWMTEEQILDYEAQMAFYKRYGDLRYYMGVEYADIAEALARRRCAEAFATDSIPADRIYVNVQPLSGSPANIAVYEALLREGDTIMGMDLTHGGHLTHGSPANVSGQRYHTVFYRVDPQTELLDYDQIRDLARKHRPRIIVAGYTSYPRAPDWQAFREIADEVGAYLLADIAHVAGMVIAGAYPTPLGYAHVITFTTHKTLCGPRGACILTTDPLIARRIDHAVFPGLQGGPHVNKFVAMAVAFRLARTERFRALQHQIVTNAKVLAEALEEEGLRVPYGGTDSHLLLVDCKTIKGPFGEPLLGDTAARVLDHVGIVCNRNTIPGDPSPALASGIRLGTPWVTQRGFREPEMRELAHLIAETLKAIRPYTYPGRRGPVYRGKVEFDTLEEARLAVAELAEKAAVDYPVECTGYPHHCLLTDIRPPESDWSLVEIEGNATPAFLEMALVEPVTDLEPNATRSVTLLEANGEVMARGFLVRPDFLYHRYRLIVPTDRLQRVLTWLRDLSDGYVLFDPHDLQAKLPGPVVVRNLGATTPPIEIGSQDEGRDRDVAERKGAGGRKGAIELRPYDPLTYKPYYIGLSAHRDAEPRGEPLPRFEWEEPEEAPLRRTPLYETHKRLGAKMVPFAGWEMPLRYGQVLEEHRAVREAAGLFDVGHMGIFEVSGPLAAPFLDLVTTNDVNRLRPGRSHYGFLLDPEGRVIDDLLVYMRGPGRYMLVVNAANTAKDWAWLNAVNEGKVQIDPDRPWVRSPFRADLVDLRAPDQEHNWRVDLALQGPRSRDVLLAWLEASPQGPATEEIRGRLLGMRRTDLIEVEWPWPDAPGGVFDLIIARTGYTGEPMGFEIFVHPDWAPLLWDLLLQFGKPLGLRPVGLAARDSLRIEAGLPLYGHELAGPLDLRPDDAGLEGYVKLYKPFFVGRTAFRAHAARRKMEVIRFRLKEQNVPMPNQGDRVLDRRGRVIGQVTSCARDTEGYLLGMAYVDRRFAKPGEEIHVLAAARKPTEKPLEELEIGDRVALASEGVVLERFLHKAG
ncbi:MAG TPA: glycine cleavage system aminomethyltransferase GcvT [Chloroflexi bacterium]|nr:glycine cleavage system aminomethyltransferase GcvT [Chloroflexota bacterium]